MEFMPHILPNFCFFQIKLTAQEEVALELRASQVILVLSLKYLLSLVFPYYLL